MGTVEFNKEVLRADYPHGSSWIAVFDNGHVSEGVVEGCYGNIAHYGESGWTEDSDDDYGEDESYGLTSLVVFHPFPNFVREMAEYTLIESAYKDVFITKDIDEGMKSGFVLDVTKPYHCILGGMIMLRKAWQEKTDYGSGCYEDFRKAGASILEAMLLSEYFFQSADGELSATVYKSDHHVWPNGTSLEDVLNTKCVNFSGPPATEHGYLYNSVWSVWDIEGKWSKFKYYHQMFQLKVDSSKYHSFHRVGENTFPTLLKLCRELKE